MNNMHDVRLVDEGSERAILAGIMKEPAKMVEASVKLRPSDFVNENNKYLYDIMLAVYNDKGGKDCRYDIAYLMSLAKQRGVEKRFIEQSGGEEYIEYLALVKDSHIDLGSFVDYVDRVSSLSIKRKLYDTNLKFQEAILESDKSPDELIVQEQTDINNILISSSNEGNKIKNLADKAPDFIKDSLAVKKEIIGIKTMFPALDSTIEGLKRGNLVIVSAPKKTGKSAFLMNVGLNVAVHQRIPTLMISTEMSDDEILSRCLANLSQVAEKKIIKGYLSDNEKESLYKAQKLFELGNFYHICMRGFTLEKIIGTVRKFVNDKVGFSPNGKVNDCLIVFDYIKMPSVGISTTQEQKEYKVLGQIADGLKVLAGDLDIPILTACQTNRGGEVANSFEITWFCNTFMVLTNKSKAQLDKDTQNGGYEGNQLLKITDNRGGSENYDGIPLDYNKPMLKYTEIPTRPQDATRQQAYGSY